MGHSRDQQLSGTAIFTGQGLLRRVQRRDRGSLGFLPADWGGRRIDAIPPETAVENTSGRSRHVSHQRSSAWTPLTAPDRHFTGYRLILSCFSDSTFATPKSCRKTAFWPARQQPESSKPDVPHRIRTSLKTSTLALFTPLQGRQRVNDPPTW